MNFITQLGVLAIILIILVILIKSNQTLEQIYMEGEPEKETIEIPSFKIPDIHFPQIKFKKEKEKTTVDEADTSKEERTVDRSSDTIPADSFSEWNIEIVDARGRSYGRTGISSFPFTIGRADDNDYVLNDLSVSGHHACLEEREGFLELVDHGSLNKILVGGRAMTRVKVIDRMEVCLGNTKVRFLKEEKASGHTVSYKRDPMMEEWY